MSASVVITTYNQPDVLERALCGYARQTSSDYELLVADDGSGSATAELIEKYAADFPVPLIHVWQPDTGFEKARAVNRAVLRSSGDYLIFSDGDCVPASRFVAEHLAAARAGEYIVGGHIRMSADETSRLSVDDVRSGRFERSATLARRTALCWLHLKSLFYIAAGKRRKPKFYGMNFSVDRASFCRVNGFDQTYKDVGREDSDLRNRMQLAGIRARSQWYRPQVFHQFHEPHSNRQRGEVIAAYYKRADLEPEAPLGLRELSAEIEAGS